MEVLPDKLKITDVAVAYPRQSKTEAEEIAAGVSLSSETQIAKAQQFAAVHGWGFDTSLSESSTDLDTPGGAKQSHRKSGVPSWQRRPGLMKLLEAARRGEFQHLVCYKLDRLGRDAAELHQIRDAFHDAGVVIHIVSEGIRSDTPGGELVFGVLASVAQMERRQISDRVKDASLQRARRRLHHGKPGKWLSIVPDTQPSDGAAHYMLSPFAETLLRLIALRMDGLSYLEIARKMNAEGLRTGLGALWTRQSVQDSLSYHNRLLYRGCAVYGKEKPEDDPQRVVTPGALPPLLSEAESDALDAVQEALTARSPGAEKAFTYRKEKGTTKGAYGIYRPGEFLCSGLLFCAVCGAAMLGKSFSPAHNRSYYCRASIITDTIPHPGRTLRGRKTGMFIKCSRVDIAIYHALTALQARIWNERLAGPVPIRRKPAARRDPDAPKRSAKEVSDAIDALFLLLEDKKIQQKDFDRRYDALVKERETAEAWEQREKEQGQQEKALARLADSKPIHEWDTRSIRLLLRQLCAKILVPVRFEGIHIATVRACTKDPLLEHVCLVLKEPLADGTVSIASAMYRTDYAGARRIVFDTTAPGK